MIESCSAINTISVSHGMDANQAGVQDSRTGTSVKLSSNSVSSRDKTVNDKSVIKLRELRQYEAKLKKWEENLKIREAKVNDSTVDSCRMEEYLSTTEARNIELEATVRTLHRKICLLENELGNLANKRSIPSSTSMTWDNLTSHLKNKIPFHS